MQPKITNLNYTYKKPDTDVWVLNTEDIPVDKSLIKDQQIVHMVPGATGGNHKHPRIEWFIGIGDFVFVWLDGNGEQHEEHMNPKGQIKLFEVPPFLPHAVTNRSKTERGVIFELADGKLVDAEMVKVV